MEELLDCLAEDFEAYRNCCNLLMELQNKENPVEQPSSNKQLQDPELQSTLLKSPAHTSIKATYLLLKVPCLHFNAPFYKISKDKKNISIRKGKSTGFTSHSFNAIFEKLDFDCLETISKEVTHKRVRWIAINGPPSTIKRTVAASILKFVLLKDFKKSSNQTTVSIYHSAYPNQKFQTTFDPSKIIDGKLNNDLVFQILAKKNPAEPTYTWIFLEIKPPSTDPIFMTITSEVLRKSTLTDHQAIFNDENKENVPFNIRTLLPKTIEPTDQKSQTTADLLLNSLPSNLKDLLIGLEPVTLSTLETTYSRIFFSETYLV